MAATHNCQHKASTAAAPRARVPGWSIHLTSYGPTVICNRREYRHEAQRLMKAFHEAALERAQGHTRRALNNLKVMGDKLPSVSGGPPLTEVRLFQGARELLDDTALEVEVQTVTTKLSDNGIEFKARILRGLRPPCCARRPGARRQDCLPSPIPEYLNHFQFR